MLQSLIPDRLALEHNVKLCTYIRRPNVVETWPGESPEPWLVSPWVLDPSRPAEIPASSAEVAELINGGKDGERQQAILSTSSSCSPSHLQLCYPHMYAKWLGDSF